MERRRAGTLDHLIAWAIAIALLGFCLTAWVAFARGVGDLWRMAHPDVGAPLLMR